MMLRLVFSIRVLSALSSVNHEHRHTQERELSHVLPAWCATPGPLSQ
jgi:hypothetical protein